jgi:hypothetical protein
VSAEDILGPLVMGFLLGLFAFGATYVRVHRWSTRVPSNASTPAGDGPSDRHVLSQPIQPSGTPLRAWLEHVVAFDRVADMIGVVLVVAMLVYGAVVAPRLRYVLASAVVTMAVAWWLWQSITKWLHRQ